jgi:hypothetical protein
MSDTNTGGPAFPCERQLTDQDVLVFEGITVRDYFAAKAMQSFTATDRMLWSNERMAAEAYDVADAMLKERDA